ncbi:hypothetical protein CMO94_03350 [Candidatus Woesearchaeota archaeon]|nr:hypothetical protein [Candidatus Woesearchaeota archaeon]
MNKKIIIITIIFLIILSIMQFTVPNITGFDGYYHIKTADIIKQEGFIKEFPWANHTILSDNYADIQILFRILLMPFTFFGLTLGAKIASILFSTIAFVIFYWFLTENKIKYAFFWSLLYLFTSANLMNRFLLPRQMPLVIALLILTIYFLQRKKYLFLGITSLIFVLLHSSFVFQLLIIILFFVLEKIFSKKFEYRILLYPSIGVILGLVINPYFPNNIFMLYTQIFKVNLIANLFNFEWKPWTFFEFVKNNILVLFYISISILVLIKNKKITKTQTFYFSLTLFFFFYTLISRRMQEYLIPFSILLTAFLLNNYIERFDRNKFFNNYHGNRRFPGHRKSTIFACFKISAVLILIIIAVTNLILLREDIKNNDFLYNFDNCAEWMKNNIPKNSLIFTNAYAFPYLFSKNSDLIYTHGIDLTYSYLYNPKEFERYMEILQGTLKDDTDYIIKDYNPDYVFSGKVKQDVQLFNYITGHKENYKAVYEDEWCAVLEVK